jgi:hypothetical protein
LSLSILGEALRLSAIEAYENIDYTTPVIEIIKFTRN